jgi:hypothetical protein
LDLDPSIIAQQITLMQHYLFSKIKGTSLMPKSLSELTAIPLTRWIAVV